MIYIVNTWKYFFELIHDYPLSDSNLKIDRLSLRAVWD